MSTDNTQQTPTPDAKLRELDRLVGTWRLEDEAEGQISFEWLPGGFFLKQDVDIVQLGERHTGIEIIGRLKPMFAEKPAEAITSRFYDNAGNTLDGSWVWPGGGYHTVATRVS